METAAETIARLTRENEALKLMNASLERQARARIAEVNELRAGIRDGVTRYGEGYRAAKDEITARITAALAAD